MTKSVKLLKNFEFKKLKMWNKKDWYIDMRNNRSKKRSGIPAYDLRLDKFTGILRDNINNEILDLWCWTGADTQYLIERWYKVLSCDFADEALKNIEKNIPNSKTLHMNIMKELPIKDESYSLIIADLSLHYFDNETTIKIMQEIKRILKPKWILLARVATINDYNFWAGSWKKLENNYYFVEWYNKRYFDSEDIKKYFWIIWEVEAKETEMIRNDNEYRKVKKLYEIKTIKR